MSCDKPALSLVAPFLELRLIPMIGQGVCVQFSSPAPPPDPCGSEALAICSSFTTASSPTPAPAPHPPSDLRRLAKAPHPTHILKCPRCASLNTKFCYYNNYSLSQPRYFCKNCKRYWTAGGVLRNVPVGGGLRKNKRSKLKLAMEAEAVAARDSLAAASELSIQQQHYVDGKPPSPVVASSGAMGSSITSTSSFVSELPANFTGAPPNFNYPNNIHLIRTSSGSDNCSGTTVEYAGNDNCAGAVAASLLLERQQNSNQLQHFFGEVHAHAAPPQFYSRYATNLPSSNQVQYAGSSSEQGASYHHAVGCGNQPSSSSMSLLGVDGVAGSNQGHDNKYSNGSRVPVNNCYEGRDLSSNERKEVKLGEIMTTNPTYDWQIISENLFNGPGTEGFMPLPGGSWPDFSQFHGPSGPG